MTSIYCYLTEDAGESCGWLGGNPPEWFDGKSDKINDSISRYGFYCTFTLADKSKSLSVFLPEKLSILLDRNIYPDCSIKVFIHPTSKESSDSSLSLMPEKPEPNARLTGYQKHFDYSRPVLNKVYLSFSNVNDTEAAFLTIGDDIFYIQNKDFYRDALIKDGYKIWGYINEDGYYPLLRRLDFVHGNMPLCFGALYFYIKNDDIVAGYWQFS